MEIGSKLRHSAKLSELLNCNCEVMGGGKRRKKGKNGKEKMVNFLIPSL